jgi:hypothetical protein
MARSAHTRSPAPMTRHPELRSAQLGRDGIDILGRRHPAGSTDRYWSRHLLSGTTRCAASAAASAIHVDRGAHGLGWRLLTASTWVATVPPTVRLAGEGLAGRTPASSTDGSRQPPACASLAAFGAGAIRTGLGDQRGLWIAEARVSRPRLSPSRDEHSSNLRCGIVRRRIRLTNDGAAWVAQLTIRRWTHCSARRARI